MTKSTRDIPTHEGMTIADRLKAARTDADFTRKALAEATGIPASTIEKYERGDMDPNTTRLQTICEHLDVSINWVLNGEDVQEASAKVTETTESAEPQASANDAETFAEDVLNVNSDIAESSEPANENDQMNSFNGLLTVLDNMRIHEFEGAQRGAIALIEEIRSVLKYCEPEELLALAVERELYQGDCKTADSILDMFRKSSDEAQAYCGNIEERIIDTAMFGIDLYALDSKALITVANELRKEYGIERPIRGEFLGNGASWGEHENFMPLIRPHLRTLTINNNGYDFEDVDEFPKREEPSEKKSFLSGDFL